VSLNPAILSGLSVVSGPVGAVAGAAGALVNLAEGIFGGGVTDTDRARLARVKSYLAGFALGDIRSAQLAQWTATKVGAAAEKSLYASALAAMQKSNSALFSAATAAGYLPDQEDGYQGLSVLWARQAHFDEQGAGHPTGEGHYGNVSQATIALAARLAALPAGLPAAPAMVPGGAPGVPSVPLVAPEPVQNAPVVEPPAASGKSPSVLWIALAIGAAFFMHRSAA